MDPTTATAGVILLLLALGGAGKKKRRRRQPQPQPQPPPEACTIEPFVYDEAQVEAAIASAIGAGMRSRERIAIWVASMIWPRYPNTDQQISWPPDLGDAVGVDASAEVICLWYKLLDDVDDYLDENGIPPWPPCEQGTHYDPVQGICAEDLAPQPQPEPFDIDEWESKGDYPSPGTFVQIRYGDRLLGTFSPQNQGNDENGTVLRSIAYTTLLSAGWMAAKEVGGLDDDAAAEFARKVAYNDANRIDYLHLIQCSPYNDALYATYGFAQKSWESPSGRALRFLPQHFDNRSRLAANLPPRRNISLGTVSDKGSGGGLGQDPSGRSFAFLWLPMINLQILWESNGTIVTTEDVTWEDGSNGIMPPPEIVALGVENVPDILWGCLGYQSNMEPPGPGGMGVQPIPATPQNGGGGQGLGFGQGRRW